MLKVGLIGVGGISGCHIPHWQKIEGVELVAICDIRPERMEKYPDIHHYSCFEDMVAHEKLDILDITLPTYLHAEYALKAMNMGIHVLCEKPISLDEKDVEKLYSTAKKNNVNFMVAHVIRFWNAYMALKRIYDDKLYGKLLSGYMTRIQGRPKWSWDNWMFDEKRSGLVPFDLHIHDLDFLVYCFGNPKNAVSNRATDENQDYINVTYQYDGFFINAETAWYAGRYPFTAGFRFQFEKAVVTYENWQFKVYTTEDEPITSELEYITPLNPDFDAYGNEILYFANCVKENKFPEIVKPQELSNAIKILHSL